ncbi:MAG: AraC family transcriptional regulator [Steroidobacteraceae bacterium]
MFRPTKIKHYLDRMQHRGFTAEAVLAGSKIELPKLQDPEYLIDIWQSQRVIANMMELTGNNALGLELGKEVRFSDFGIVGYALMSARSMRDVIKLWIAFSHSLIGVMLKIDLVERPNEWRVTFSEIVPMGSLLRFCVEENLTFGQWIGETVVQQPIHYSKVELSYPAPAHQEAYRGIFKGPVVFGAQETAVNVLSPSIEVQAPDNRDSELFNACQQYCHQVLRKITAERPLAFRLRNLFLRSSGQFPTLEEAAAKLHLSTRTLRRHLDLEGVSYQELLNEFRCDLAKEYLKTSYLPVQEIGYLLGYQDPKAFPRAFKAWTGMTLTQYRAQHASKRQRHTT